MVGFAVHSKWKGIIEKYGFSTDVQHLVTAYIKNWNSQLSTVVNLLNGRQGKIYNKFQ